MTCVGVVWRNMIHWIPDIVLSLFRFANRWMWRVDQEPGTLEDRIRVYVNGTISDVSAGTSFIMWLSWRKSSVMWHDSVRDGLAIYD